MATGTRKAPTASATLFKPGTTKTGNDGNKWTIVADTRGVQRWQLKKKLTTATTMKRRKTKSARVLAMEADPNTVWGKNKPLEELWNDLASERKVVVIYAKPSSSHKIVTMPTSKTANKKKYIEFDDDPNIIAVLCCFMPLMVSWQVNSVANCSKTLQVLCNFRCIGCCPTRTLFTRFTAL